MAAQQEPERGFLRLSQIIGVPATNGKKASRNNHRLSLYMVSRSQDGEISEACQTQQKDYRMENE